MKNFIIIAILFATLLASKMTAQSTFEGRAKKIALKMEVITKEKKAKLKVEIEAINNQLIAGTITKETADENKRKQAQITATEIETEIAPLQDELKNLVQEQVDGKLKERDTNSVYVDFGGKRELKIKKRKIRDIRSTSQFVFATGVNNVATGGSINNSDFRYWGSHFYEVGLTYNSRLAKNNNLLHLKYGFSFVWNNLRPTENRNFVVTGNQTELATSPINLDDSRFRNIYLVAPLHLEFDFSGKEKKKDGKEYFTSHESFRMGFGGYAGINLQSKQFAEYNMNGYDTETETCGDFNTSNFIYGVSTYIGYKETSLYVKYDLNPLFNSNAVKQNNVSLGIRFDFN
jgi:hypothetical protein